MISEFPVSRKKTKTNRRKRIKSSQINWKNKKRAKMSFSRRHSEFADWT
ncbi:unnamed protein product [Oikopleura dioica]|uniref:Uncharacterized protein n=1 Tax=Oikopleura dioica TaxID=34765 RepID=E4YXQ2_OIKDI|nr:unnamed protein product [Oikopleura dioica]